MKRWLQLISDFIKAVLHFMTGTRQEEPVDEKSARIKEEEINEKVANADDDELTDIAVSIGLVSRPDIPGGTEGQPDGENRTSDDSVRSKRSRFKSGKHLI